MKKEIKLLHNNLNLKDSLIIAKNQEMSLENDKLIKLNKDFSESIAKENINLDDNKDKDRIDSSDNNDSGPILSPYDSEWYTSLSTIQKLSVTLLAFNSVIFSCVISIIFTLYGDYPINRFSLESRYPKLAKYISLRIKFQNYYLKISLLIILIDVLVQILLFISIIGL